MLRNIYSNTKDPRNSDITGVTQSTEAPMARRVSRNPGMRSALRRLFTSWSSFALALALASATPAFAQTTTATAPSDQQATLAEVTITGSRIPVPANITATSPTSVVTSEDIKLQGTTDMVDMMNLLPQNVVSAGFDFSNTSNPISATGGIATVDLRGLGPQRTLVLVNGRRLGVGDPSTTNPAPAPDIDQIPAPLVERVDVVTGGASATYGSDAIAGVVNFILKKDFQGIQVDGQYGFFQHDQHNSYIQGVESTDDPNTGWSAITPPTGSTMDGVKHDLSIIMGTNFADGAGNITAYFVAHNQNPILGTERDFSDCQAVTNSLFGAPVASGYECYGTQNSNYFQTTGVAPTAGNAYSVVGNQLLPFPQAGSVPPAYYNYNAYEYLQREDKRYQAGFMAHDDLNDYVKPYMEFSFMNDKTTSPR